MKNHSIQITSVQRQEEMRPRDPLQSNSDSQRKPCLIKLQVAIKPCPNQVTHPKRSLLAALMALQTWKIWSKYNIITEITAMDRTLT